MTRRGPGSSCRRTERGIGLRASAGHLLFGAAMLIASMIAVAGVQEVSPGRQFEEAVTLMSTRRDFAAAALLFEKVADGNDRVLAARALVYLGECYERMADAKARAAYRRVIGPYPDQAVALAQARTRLAALDRRAAGPDVVRRSFRPLMEQRPPPSSSLGRMSLDGRFLAVRLRPEGALKLQDVATGRIEHTGRAGQSQWESTALRGLRGLRSMTLSPNASEVAFFCKPDAGGFPELRVARLYAPRANVKTLLTIGPGEFAEVMEWRHRSRLLVQIVRPTGTARLVVVSTSVGSATSIVDPIARTVMASLSPDGAFVVFDGPAVADRARRSVFITPVVGGASRTLVAEPADDRLPIWTPDGQGVVFVSDRTGTTGLWRQDVTNGQAVGGPRLLFPDLGRVVMTLGLSATGRFVYFRETGLVDVHVLEFAENGLPFSPPRNASTRGMGRNLMPAWSPDSSQLAYAMRGGGLAVQDTESAVQRLVGQELRGVTQPRWSPDGRMILVRAYDADWRVGAYTIDVQNDRLSAVKVVGPTEESSLGFCRWEKDGGAVFCMIAGKLVRISMETGEEQVVSTFPPNPGGPAPDVSLVDNSVVFVRLDTEKSTRWLTVRAPDGTLRNVFESMPKEVIRNPVWLPNNRGVVFSRLRAVPERLGATVSTLWRLDFDTGVPRPIDIALDNPRDPAVSPDGRYLAFTSGRSTREPWVLENLQLGRPRR